MRNRIIILFFLAIIIVGAGCSGSPKNVDDSASVSLDNKRWSQEQADQWYASQPWFRGANFNPSSAVNQLETWQAESFDPETIDRELGWAQAIGFNCMRVFLHHKAWEVDKKGFKGRMNQFLEIADKHQIKIMFVFFDDCWNPTYEPGKQPDPKPGVHNSGWVQDPGTIIRDTAGNINNELVAELELYVKDILTTFANDKRIFLWDLYNEPGNSKHKNNSMYLLQKVFEWAYEIRPSQPVTSGVWSQKLTDLNKFQLEHSDIITYHNYADEIGHQKAIDTLKLYNRPLICSEYMARRNNSRFQNIMPILKQNKIGAINWGLVAGKSNTIFAWDTPLPDVVEPELWFHDIFRKDGSPFSQEEVDFIKEITAN